MQDNPVCGSIDGVDAGCVFGWAVDLSDTESQKISIETSDGTLVAAGEPNVLRNDLIKKNIGTHGRHGFRFLINSDIKMNISKNSKLNIVINKKVITTDQTMLANDGWFWGACDKLHNNIIRCSVVSECFEGVKNIVVYDGDEAIYSAEHTLVKGENHFHINLPLSVMDNSDKLIVLGVSGFPFALWSGYIYFEEILTPWEYLKGSYKESGLLSLSRQSQFRYESLNLRLLNDDVDKKSSVAMAHAVIAEGWKNRKNFPQLTLPKYDNPDVSIILPAFNKFELTYNCIASIILAYNKTSYEVLVADDCSDDETKEIGSYIKNVRHIRTAENMRFLLNCKNAVKYAKGNFLVFLNNDTEVTSYWLDALLEPFEDESVGMTGSKLLNLDGTLQEAGGIVWGSGVPWNVGNGSSPIIPEYNYNRQADYLTGASMCVSKGVWDEIGGFSEEFVPCYYEDTDIAFKVRELGKKTIYCPFSRVIHFEGQSHGKDVTKGLKAYQVVNSSTFKTKWFKQYKHNGKEGVDLHLEKDRGIDYRVLMIDYATPNPSADAGSYAAIQEIKLIQSLGMKVTFIPENMAHLGKITQDLQKMGVEVLYAPFYMSVFEAIETRIAEFDAIYITRYSVAEKYIDAIRQRTQAKIIFNNADLHFLRQLRTVGNTDEYSLDEALATRTDELTLMNKVDAILSYNETEHAVILSHNLKHDNIFKCPWVLSEKGGGKEFSEREGIAFLGGYRHHPNVKAVEFFAKQVLPKIVKAQPDIVFYVYGSHVPDTIKELESDNIRVVGFAENLDDIFYNHRVIVAPLLSGAGIKGKVLEAMSYGVPQVLTSVGAEATGLSHKISAWIADDAENLAKGVLQVYEDEKLWNKFSENSRILAQESYSQEHGRKLMQKVFNYVGIYSV